MAVLITGVAGFIGFHTAQVLLARDEEVIGIDNLNDYYDPTLKEARLSHLKKLSGFSFVKGDVAERADVETLFIQFPQIDRIIHLSAQAGVRYSLINPYSYTRNNIEAHLILLEAARSKGNIQHFVYASSSSVYGSNTKLPFSTQDRVDNPVSLYAATKKSMELMSHTYAHLFGIPLTGMRFFTVYGPWGRPDMALFIFTRKVVAGEPIPVFNNGEMRRDFTYIDDIVDGVVGCLDNPPEGSVPNRIYNIGNHRSEKLMDYIAEIEKALGRKAELDLQPMQPGDVAETYADISDTQADFNFEPKTTIREGIPKFIAWYKEFYGV